MHAQLAADKALYVRTFDTFIVQLPPLEVRRGRADEAAVRLIARTLDGRCGRSGYVRPHSVQLVARSAGLAVPRGSIEFHVRVQYDCCAPLVNTLFRAPLCVCVSNNRAGIIGEIRDSHGNVAAMVAISREGVASDASTNDLAFAALLASPGEMDAVQPGDTFGCLVRSCAFELGDPMVNLLGQLISRRAETAPQEGAGEEGAATAPADGDNLGNSNDDDDGTSAVEHLADYRRILVAKRVDLDALRARLVQEEAVRSVGTPAAAAAAAGRLCQSVPTLAEYSLPNDHTAYITIALQETPLLATSITRRHHGLVQRMPSFLQVWNTNGALRAVLLAHLAEAARGAPSAVRDRTGQRPLDDIVELRWQEQNNFGYKLATTFMPAYAKAIYAHFQARRILDPCGGWGDRLAGALALREQSRGALAQTYVSFDPNRALRRGYRRIAELFGAAEEGGDGDGDGDRTSLRFDNGYACHALPFESGAPQLLQDDSFDLVFTSPPFFDYEVYSADNPEYGSDWLGQFYRPLMLHSARCVEPGGHVCIHIDDTSAGSIESFLCEEVPTFTRLKLRGRIALRGVLSKQARSVWVFQKSGGSGSGSGSS